LCGKAKIILNQIKIYEPTYNMNFKNCSDNLVTGIEKTNNLNINNQTNAVENYNNIKDNYMHKNNNSELISALILIFFMIVCIISIILKHNEEKEEAIRREYEEDLRKQIELERLEQEREQKELEEKRRIQEEYRRKQIENQRLEQERKQREIEEQKRKTQERAMRLQKNYWYNHVKDFEFENKIGEIFQELGFEVKVTQKSGDGGVDVIIKKDNVIKCVQCKHYSENNTVKIGDIRALWGVKEDFNAESVIMVTTGKISKEGIEFIKKRKPNYELWTIDTIIAKAKEANYNYKS